MDMISSQIGGRVATLLGLPLISYARRLEVEGGEVKAVRDLEEGLEMVKAKLPAVLSVTGEVNKPRIPTLIQIRGAFRKPVKRYALTEPGVEAPPKPEILSLKVLQVQRKRTS